MMLPCEDNRTYLGNVRLCDPAESRHDSTMLIEHKQDQTVRLVARSCLQKVHADNICCKPKLVRKQWNCRSDWHDLQGAGDCTPVTPLKRAQFGVLTIAMEVPPFCKAVKGLKDV